MSSYLFYAIIVLVFFFLELLYFRIAYRYKIFDQPNHRSSHQDLVIRGGGIIFPVAALAGMISSGDVSWYFLTGLLLISGLSFWDDIVNLPFPNRLAVQLLSGALLMAEFSPSVGVYWIPVIYFLTLAAINAYNFMDGINGIIAGYSVVTLLTLCFINTQVRFVADEFLLSMVIAAVVFAFFNFRHKALCFAGDVGSISMAFVLAFLIIRLITQTGNFLYIALLLVFGLDTATTIVLRMVQDENIFKAHRRHFYQYLVNERSVPHLQVSFLYCLSQMMIDLFIVFGPFDKPEDSLKNLTWLVVMAMAIFVTLRIVVQKRTAKQQVASIIVKTPEADEKHHEHPGKRSEQLDRISANASGNSKVKIQRLGDYKSTN